MKKAILSVLVSLAFAQASRPPAEGWRGIVPLRTTCDDVKKALKVEKCGAPMSEYNVPGFRVVVFFSSSQCCDDPAGWRVPPGTVTSLIISPVKKMRPPELGIDLSEYLKLPDRDVVGMEAYENRGRGIAVNLSDGFVQDIIVAPPAKDEGLRCKPAEDEPLVNAAPF
ncbi:MAG TPA: hypothetical protein VN228_18915 [Pyrinomonadaceae bacterium]|nr:hypothetical protein [Pyrinomonadaceae bacterium]